MSKFFRQIRKKRNIPCIVAVFFLLLMSVELFGHAQKELNNLIPERPPQYFSINSTSENIDDDFDIYSFGKSLLWSDQASHHQVLITSLYFDFTTTETSCERIPFHFADSLYKSLAPPYLPPEII